MKSQVVKIIDPIGIHARPASKITNEATKYKSEITFIIDGRTTNAKSLINLMALGAKCGNKIEICTKGLDEVEALNGVVKVMKDTKLI